MPHLRVDPTADVLLTGRRSAVWEISLDAKKFTSKTRDLPTMVRGVKRNDKNTNARPLSELRDFKLQLL